MAPSPISPTARPPALKKTSSFTRFEPPPPTTIPSRSRGNTLSNEVTGPQILSTDDGSEVTKTPSAGALVDKRKESVVGPLASEMSATHSPDIDSFPDNFDELPVELASLTDK